MSNIDETKPTAGTALTADVRANFAAAKSEIEALGNGSAQYAAAGGTVDAITVSLTHTITSYADGLQINVRAAGANATTTPTLNIDSVGAKTITKLGNDSLRIGDIPKADYECIFRYNSTNDVFELLNPALYPPLSGETGIENHAYSLGNVLRFIPQDLHSSIRDGTNTTVLDSYIQNAIDSGFPVKVPPGTYKIVNLDFEHSGSYYRNDTGIIFEGAGADLTIFTREEVATPITYSDEDTFVNEFAFRIFGSHHKLSGFRLEDCKGGIFLGQDHSLVSGTPSEHSSTCFNEFNGIVIADCGTGIMSASTNVGSYFNTYRDIHITQCQVGVDFREGKYQTLGVPTNNRNAFYLVRASRCYIGFLMESASTNAFYSVLNEGNVAAPTNNGYSYPANSITAVDISAAEGIGMLFSSSCNNNTITANNETCDRYIIDDSTSNIYLGGTPRFVESATSTGTPEVILDRNCLIQKDSFFFSTNTLPGFSYPAGKNIHIPDVVNWATTGDRRTSIHEIASIADTATETITLQADASTLSDVTCLFEVKIVADDSGVNLAHSKTFSVLLRRNTARTPVRYYLFDAIDTRSNGANSGDATEVTTVTLSLSSKDLQLNITPPAGRDFDETFVFVTEIRTKH